MFTDSELDQLHKNRVVLRTLVAGLDHITLSRGCEHAPVIFFSSVFKSINLEELKSTSFILRCLEEKKLRVQPLGFDRNSWEERWNSACKRGESFVKGLIQFFRIFGYKGCFDLFDLVAKFSILDFLNLVISQVKVHTVYLSGLSRGVSSPVTELLGKPGCLMDYPSCKWLIQKLTSSKSRYQTYRDVLGETLLLGIKRGFPSMHDSQVVQNISSYLSFMSVEKVTPQDALNEVERTCEELFCYPTKCEIPFNCFETVGINRTGFSIPIREFKVSQRAGYGAPITRGGILGFLMRDQNAKGLVDNSVTLLYMYEFRPGFVKSAYGVPLNSRRMYEVYLNESKKNFSDKLCQTQIYGIREPLKLRTITAGEPTVYGILKPLQKAMWEKLREYDQFRLIGEKLTNDLLVSVLNKKLPDDMGKRGENHIEGERSFFISGDYSAATNEMHMDVTTKARDVIFGTQDHSFLSKLALGPQVLNFPELESVEQKRGQLMGSPLSFPILCSINMAMIRASYEEYYNRSFLIRDLPVLINGDDLLARVPRGLYEIWCKWIKKVGWRLSAGKSYFLQDFVQINSETRRVIPCWNKDRSRVFYEFQNRIPFVNFGYVNSLKKAVKQIDEPVLESFSRNWSERFSEIENYPQFVYRPSMHYLLNNLDRMTEDLFRVGHTPFKLSVINPIEFGGLGIVDKIMDQSTALKSLDFKPIRNQMSITDYFEEFEEKEEKIRPFFEQIRSSYSHDEEGLCQAVIDDIDRKLDKLIRGEDKSLWSDDLVLYEVEQQGTTPISSINFSFICSQW